MANVFYCPLCGKEKGVFAYCVPEIYRRCQHDISQLMDTGMTDEEHASFTRMPFWENAKMLEDLIELKKTDLDAFQAKIAEFDAVFAQKQQEKEEQKRKEEQERNTVRCPKCSCTNIQVVPRKWSFWTGFLTNKTDRVCVKCGYKF